MVVSVHWYAFPTGPHPGGEVGPITNIDFITANNAVSSSENRLAYPIPIGLYSYEKWLNVYFTATAGEVLRNFRFYGGGSLRNQTTMVYCGRSPTWQTPIMTGSHIARTRWSDLTPENPLLLGEGPYTVSGWLHNYLVLQLYGDYYQLNKGHWGPEDIIMEWDLE